MFIGPKPASAELVYRLMGSDRLAVGRPAIDSAISYDGSESLRITHVHGTSDQVFVKASYQISNGRTRTAAIASAQQALDDENGATLQVTEDPAYLTLLTQPFAFRLDLATIREASTLDTELPFTSVSPLTGSTLKGSLTRGTSGVIAGFPVLVLHFHTDGPITGGLPNNDQIRLTGHVHMDGTACYRRVDGILLGLQTMLTIEGHIGDNGSGAPVLVVYKRNIRATGQAWLSGKTDGYRK